MTQAFSGIDGKITPKMNKYKMASLPDHLPLWPRTVVFMFILYFYVCVYTPFVYLVG